MGNDLSRPVPKERPMALVRRMFGNMTRKDVIERLVTLTLKNDDSGMRTFAAKANLTKQEMHIYYNKIGRLRGEFCSDIPEIEYREFANDFEDDSSSMSSISPRCPDSPRSAPVSPMFPETVKQTEFETFCKTKYGMTFDIKRIENIQAEAKDIEKTDGQPEKPTTTQAVEPKPTIAGDCRPKTPITQEPSQPVIQQAVVESPRLATPPRPPGFQMDSMSPSKARLEVPKFSSPAKARMMHTPVEIKPLVILPHLLRCDSDIPAGNLAVQEATPASANQPRQAGERGRVPPQEFEKPPSIQAPSFANPPKQHGVDLSKAADNNAFDVQLSGRPGCMAHTPVPIKKYEVLSHHVVPCETDLPIYMDPTRHQAVNKPAQSVAAFANQPRQHGVDSSKTADKNGFDVQVAGRPGCMAHTPVPIKQYEVLSHHVVPCETDLPIYMDPSRHQGVTKPAQNVVSETVSRPPVPNNISQQPGDGANAPQTELERLEMLLDSIPTPRQPGESVDLPPELMHLMSGNKPPPNQAALIRNASCSVVGVPAPRRPNERKCRFPRHIGVQTNVQELMARPKLFPDPVIISPRTIERIQSKYISFSAKPTRPRGVQQPRRESGQSNSKFAQPTRPSGVQQSSREPGRYNATSEKPSRPREAQQSSRDSGRYYSTSTKPTPPRGAQQSHRESARNNSTSGKPKRQDGALQSSRDSGRYYSASTEPSGPREAQQSSRLSGRGNSTFANPARPYGLEQYSERAASNNRTFANPPRQHGTDSSTAEHKQQNELLNAVEVQVTSQPGRMAHTPVPIKQYEVLPHHVVPCETDLPIYMDPSRNQVDTKPVQAVALKPDPTFANPSRQHVTDKQQNELSNAVDVEVTSQPGRMAHTPVPIKKYEVLSHHVVPCETDLPIYMDPSRNQVDMKPEQSVASKPDPTSANTPGQHGTDKQQIELSNVFDVQVSSQPGRMALTPVPIKRQEVLPHHVVSCETELPNYLDPSTQRVDNMPIQSVDKTPDPTFTNPTKSHATDSSKPVSTAFEIQFSDRSVRPAPKRFANLKRPFGVEPPSEPPATTNPTFAKPTRPCGVEQTSESPAPTNPTSASPTRSCVVPTNDKPVSDADAIPIFASQSGRRVVHTPVPTKPTMRPDSEVPVFTSPSKQPVANSPVPRLQLAASPDAEIPGRTNEIEQPIAHSSEECKGKASPRKSHSRMLGKIGQGLLSRNTATPKPKASSHKPVAADKPPQKSVEASSHKPVAPDKPAQKVTKAASRKPVANYLKETAAAKSKRLAGFNDYTKANEEKVIPKAKDENSDSKDKEDGKGKAKGDTSDSKDKIEKGKGKVKGIISRCVSSLKRRTESAMSNHKIIKVKPATPDCKAPNNPKNSQPTQRSARPKEVKKVDIPMSNQRPDKGIIWPTEFHALSSHGKAYYVEQFRRSEKFKQRLVRKNKGGETWMNGMNPFQLWVVENEGTQTMYDILHPVPKAQTDAQSKVKCWRGKDSPEC